MVSIAAILAVYLTPLQDKLIGSNATSFESRQAMWTNTIPAIKDHVVLGSGVGSFPRLYPQYEDQAAVSLTFVNHAHNDYIEIALEAGLPGIVLVVSFLMWWGGRAVSAWRTPRDQPLRDCRIDRVRSDFGSQSGPRLPLPCPIGSTTTDMALRYPLVHGRI